MESNRVYNKVGKTWRTLERTEVRKRVKILKEVCFLVCVCKVCTCLFVYLLVRAEPVLARIKEDHKRIILPSIDNIKHDTFEVERYENSGHGYNWELWCMYINPPKQWWDEGDTSAPIRQASSIYTARTADHHFLPLCKN